MKIYGVINERKMFIDICKTEKGIKRYATINDINSIGYRIEMYVTVTHEKINNKWCKI